MDPQQTLHDAEEHLRDGQLAETLEALELYWSWRRGGGFEPAGGDRLARRLGRRVAREKQRHDPGGPKPLSDCLDELAEREEWARDLHQREADEE